MTAARRRTLAGAALLVAVVAALPAGRPAISVLLGALMLLAYHELRGLLAPWGHVITFVLGAAGVGGFLWSGYQGNLELVPAVGAGMVATLVVSRVVLYEAGAGKGTGITLDVSATLAAVGVAGIGGAHILLIRTVPRFGFRGLLAFVVLVAAVTSAAMVVGRWRGRRPILPPGIVAGGHPLTWEGAAAGLAAGWLTGLVVGLAVGRPFDAGSGMAFGAGSGVMVLAGHLAFAVLAHGGRGHAGVKRSMGVLDVAGGAIFAAPAFYWAFRTLAL